ncbi:Bifunctional ligase/repressor BirA [bioreactor metagenome]|uniref:Bifunctional ligase/repressor BirA n=1 Tax=bioreactor metagenome TaxID=1076179 RepID=A0A645BYW5_9ZZZZ
MKKDDVLKLLLANRGKIMSGGAMARELNVSRTAVWKMINQLKEEGIAIGSAANEGYFINANEDILCKGSVEMQLFDGSVLSGLDVLERVDSTNSYLKQKASQNFPDRYVVIAAEQDGGRGRMKRNFYSPKGQGVYMSVLLRPNLHISKINFLTILSALAVYDAIYECSGVAAGIKWPNDLVFEKKKLCGILTEAAIEGESGIVDYAIVGMGINLKQNQSDFPCEIQEVATSVRACGGREVSRDRFSAQLIEAFFRYYDSYMKGDKLMILKVYKERLCMLHKKITVLEKNGSYTGEAIDIDDEARLLVKKENGDVAVLFAGEISIRDF